MSKAKKSKTAPAVGMRPTKAEAAAFDAWARLRRAVLIYAATPSGETLDFLLHIVDDFKPPTRRVVKQ
jgi:hypothetical protein